MMEVGSDEHTGMNIRFKKVNETDIYTIEGANLTIIKVALLVHYGVEHAFQLFQKKLTNDILLYCPTRREADNLTKRSFDKYIEENHEEIQKAIDTITLIEDEN